MKLILALLLVVLVSGCTQPAADMECHQDSDCFVAGCSSQLCVPEDHKDIITTCEYKSEYECLKQTSCGCAENKCRWKETEVYRNCLENVVDIGPVF